MDTADDISRLISDARQRLANYQATVADCDKKIDRLKPVYKELKGYKESFRSERKRTNKIFKSAGSWRGKKKNDFLRKGDSLDSAFGDYYKTQLDAAHDAINTEIARLEAKKLELIPLIGPLLKQVQEWEGDLQNKLNGG